MEMGVDTEKRRAALASADLVEDGMRVGLGTGSTVAYLLAELAQRRPDVSYVATSPHTATIMRDFGIEVDPFDRLERLDLAIDGADQFTSEGWLIKGGGGAHTREKIVAASTDRFVVIADASKMVESLRAPVPLELLGFGLAATLAHLRPVTVRDVSRSPDGGVIADYFGPLDDPAALDTLLSAVPGVIAHGLFPPYLVSEILLGRGETLQRITIGGYE
jgi:ribose 5-phosphate isomerase A